MLWGVTGVGKSKAGAPIVAKAERRTARRSAVPEMPTHIAGLPAFDHEARQTVKPAELSG